MPAILFRQDESHFVELDLTRPCAPNSAGFWDGNWLRLAIRGAALGAINEYVLQVRLVALERFFDKILGGEPRGKRTVKFSTDDGDFQIVVAEVTPVRLRLKFVVSPCGARRGTDTYSFFLPRAALEGIAEQLKLTFLRLPHPGDDKALRCGIDVPTPN